MANRQSRKYTRMSRFGKYNKKKNVEIVRCFEVTEPTQHTKGHTIYKVTQKLISVNQPDENVEQIIVWRRYNDFKKLYKAMLQLHNSLHRKEEFPPFSKPTVFGRFEKEVLIERQRCAQDLLNFIGQKKYFVISKAFQQFFKDGEKTICSNVNNTPFLQPSVLTKNGSDEATDALYNSDVETLSSDTLGNNVVQDEYAAAQGDEESAETLGGIWQYRQVVDKISLGDLDDDSDVTEDSASCTPLPLSETTFFDPYPIDKEYSSIKVEESNSEWLLAAMETCGVEQGVQDNNHTPDELGAISSHSITENSTASFITNEEVKYGASASIPEFYIDPASDDKSCVDIQEDEVLNTQNKLLNKTTLLHANASTEKGHFSHEVQMGKGDENFSIQKIESSNTNALDTNEAATTKSPASLILPSSPMQIRKNLSLLNLDLKDKGDYIFQAANQISLGQLCEANGNYSMAFNYFRTGVGILLTGVQLDENAARREVVRRKTAKYLVKAEKLHKLCTEVKGENVINDIWDPLKASPTRALIDPGAVCLQGSLTELVNYKVIGVIDKVMLVLDNVDNKCYVMKILQKACLPNSTNKKRNIIPLDCPFMVKLHKFYESENAIILIIQHIPGGKLWNYISNFFHNSNLRNKDIHDISELTLKDKQYSGNHNIELTENKLPSNVHDQAIVHNPLDPGYSAQLENDANSNVNCTYSIRDLMESNSNDTSQSHSESTKALCSNIKDIKNLNDESVLKSKDVTEDNLSHFQDFLENVKEKPPIEAFSVDSFDSKIESRLQSISSEHSTCIQTIKEVCEHDKNTPAVCDGESNDSPHFNLHVEKNSLCSPQFQEKYVSTEIINSNSETFTTVEENNTHIISSDIYDYERSPLNSSNTSCSNSWSGDHNSSIKNKASHSKSVQISSQPVDNNVFRQLSQDRSLETGKKQKKRTMSGLSAAFGELNLASEENFTTKIPENCIRQWATEIILAIDHLHKLGIICLDLNPCNLLLGERGHVCLTYFSYWCSVDCDIMQKAAVDPLYIAPEVLGCREYSASCDWWSLGTLLFELFCGKKFSDFYPCGISSHTLLELPNTLSSEAQDLLRQLLKYNPEERLGSSIEGIENIKSHPFFQGVNWKNSF